MTADVISSHINYPSSPVSSVGRAWELKSKGHGFEPHNAWNNILCQDSQSNEDFTGTSSNKIKSEFEMIEK